MKKSRAGAGLVVAGFAAVGVFGVVGVIGGAQNAPAPAAPAPVVGTASQTGVGGTAKTLGSLWRAALKAPAASPALSPQEEMKTISVPPGYHVELVASEPLVESPILMDFDPDGRLWVLELKGFLPDTSGRDSMEPVNDVVVLEDTNGDGVMDKRTVFADKLVMPRALKVLDHGVLVGEPPNMWLMRDTDGDLKADTKELVTGDFGRANGGIEHNANSTFWAMDNVMYSSEHTLNLRMKDGKIGTVPSLSRGQWQVSQDDAGRIYRNVNDAPIYVDYTPASYFLRNPNVARTRGLYELLIEQADALIYPIRQNRGVNRGYRESFFRADGSSTIIQGAGTPTIYRGDKYPKAMQGAALITDSPTNLVHAFKIVDDGAGRLSAKNMYPRGEFFASSDERCRPVSLFSGPDGSMYVVDIYRGVVQAGGIWSDYLTEYIKAHDMQLPTNRGRIWRVVYGAGPNARGPKPSFSTATPAALVDLLSHPNGWQRDTAQRLLVERGDKSVAPALTTLATAAADWRTKLHALWTLDGIDAIEPATVERALTDLNPDVRAAGVRISERWLRQPDQPIAAAVLKLADDRNWNVRRQVAASIGELPAAARVEPATAMFTKYGSDPIIVDALVSGLKGQESEVLGRVLQARVAAPMAAPSEGVAMLVAAATKGGDLAVVQSAIDVATDAAKPAWQRQAVLTGLNSALPTLQGGGGGGGRGGGRGGGGAAGLPGLSAPGGRVVMIPGRSVTLTAEPAALIKLAAGKGELAQLALAVSNKLDWAGRPAPIVIVAPLTPVEQRRLAAGQEIYKTLCVNCHQEDGRGKEKVGGNLVDSAYVNAADPTSAIRILLNGKEGLIGLMPPVAYNDDQIASALTFVRRSWGHTAPAVDPLSVGEIRGLSKARNRPWTDAELLAAGGRGGGRGGGGRAGGGAGAGAPAGAPAGPGRQ